MALYQKEIKNPDGTTSFVGGATEQDVNSAITAQSLTPQKPIELPPAPADTTNYSGITTGGNAVVTSNSTTLTPPTTQSSIDSEYQKLLSLIAQPSAIDTYNADYAAAGVDTKQATANVDAAALQTATDEFNAVNAQLAGINAEAQAIPIQQQKDAEGRGITAAGLAPITAAALRENALKAIPLQAQALVAQAAVAAAQGKANLSQSILQQAQDHVDKVYQIHLTDATNQYNYKKNLLDTIYASLTAAEKTRAEAQQKKADQDFTLLRDNLSNQNDYVKAAIASGQGALAGKLAALDPKSSTYTNDLARLASQIKPKPSAGEIDQATIVSVNNQLTKAKGSDGYTDPNLYARLRSSSSLSGADFDNRFGYLVNPLSAARLGLTNAITSQGALSPADYTKGLNYLLQNGATADDQAKFQTDRAFQAWVLGKVGT